MVFEVVEEGSDVGAQQFAGPVFRQVDVVIDLVAEVFDGVFGDRDEQFGAVVEVVHEPALGDACRGGDGLDGYAEAFGDEAADGGVENTAASVFGVPEATARASWAARPTGAIMIVIPHTTTVLGRFVKDALALLSFFVKTTLPLLGLFVEATPAFLGFFLQAATTLLGFFVYDFWARFIHDSLVLVGHVLHHALIFAGFFF